VKIGQNLAKIWTTYNSISFGPPCTSVTTTTTVIWQKVKLLFACICYVAAYNRRFARNLQLHFPLWSVLATRYLSPSNERFKQGAQIWQTDNRPRYREICRNMRNRRRLIINNWFQYSGSAIDKSESKSKDFEFDEIECLQSFLVVIITLLTVGARAEKITAQ